MSLVDGLYLHLIKYRLHERADSRQEHLLHSLRSLLFLLMFVAFYYFKAQGVWLFIGLLFLLADIYVESRDMLIEAKSREFQGGLPSFEYALHGNLILARNLGLGLWLASISLVRVNWITELLFKQIIISSFLMLMIHLVLYARPNILSDLKINCCGANNKY